MDQTKPARGRARGRVRPTAEQQAAPGGLPGPSTARTTGSWAAGNPLRAPGSSTQPPVTSVTSVAPTVVAATPTTVAVAVSGKDGNGRDERDSHSGRGAMRGRRPLPENILATRLPNLGKQGTSGRSIVLQTNYFRLESRPDWCILQYRVDFAPEVDVTRIKKRLFYVATARMNIKGVFDGSVLFTTPSFRISPDSMEIVVDSLNDPDQKVRITIRLVGELDPSSYATTMVYNVIMRKCMTHLNLQEIKRNYYDPAARIVVSDYNLELWPGLITSTRQHESNLLMCVEVKHGVVKTNTVLHEMMRMCNDRRYGRDWKEQFKQRMLNAYVLTDYNNKTYRIDDVDFNMSPASTFLMKDGSSCSFVEYYRKAHGITINQMDQPLFSSKQLMRGPDNTTTDVIIQLVPELCRLTTLTEEERKNRLMKTALEPYLQPGPASRIASLNKFNQRLQNTPGSIQEMSNFDLTLSKEIVTLTGRVLPAEKLRYNDGHYMVGANADWTRDMRNKPLFRNGKLNQWAVIHSPKDERAAMDFMSMMLRAASGMSWSWAKPTICVLRTTPERPHDKAAYARAIEEVLVKNPLVTFFLLIVPPSKSADTFGAIKKKLTVDKGIASQCVAASTCVHKNAMSIATKVAVQMCPKTGGAPWAIINPLKGLMVVGYDVCHDPTNKAGSFGAFTASYDPNLTAYFSAAFAHKDGEELCNNMSANMAHAVNYFAKENAGALPTYILFYRDGVGEGQLCYVYEHELKKIYATLGPMYERQGQQLRLRMIIVNKRHNTRLFEQGKNPPAGTVVDDVITMPERSDFFLVSQCTTRGTASPTYYSILGPDNFGLNANQTQILTHRLCHQYYNWSGTVRVPAPCQYAHKLAFMTAQYLQRPPNQRLCHLLHFL